MQPNFKQLEFPTINLHFPGSILSGICMPVPRVLQRESVCASDEAVGG